MSRASKRAKKEIIIPPDNELPTPAPTTPKMISVESLLELHSKGLSHTQISKILGCNPSNVTHRLQTAGVTSLRDYKKNRADFFAATQSRMLNNITEEDMKKASLSQKVVAAGILYDKERLERDLSTQNIKPLVFFGEPPKKALEDAPGDTIEGEVIVE